MKETAAQQQGRLKRKPTIADVAIAAQVSKSTVSGVLNGHAHSGRVSESTRRRIFESVRELKYVPVSSAQALATGRTYHIGFMVSSSTTLGLANTCFSTIMSGVQHACQQRGYNCVTSAYKLSDIEQFVIPRKLQRRSVDGVVITGAVCAEVVDILSANGIPFVLSGDCTDAPLEGILAVASDMASAWVNALCKLAELGHRRIELCSLITRSATRQYEEAASRFLKKYPNDGFEIRSSHTSACPEQSEFERGFAEGNRWLAKGSQRPTAVFSSDQWIVGFLSAIIPGGAQCPRDVSVISDVDTPMMQWYIPKISALDLGLFDNGVRSANLLIDVLDGHLSVGEAAKLAEQYRRPPELIMRESVGPAPG